MNSKKTLTDMANYVHHNIDIVCDVKYDKKKGYIASINLGHFTFGNSDRLGQWAVERLHEELEFYVKTSLEYRELKEENSKSIKR